MGLEIFLQRVFLMVGPPSDPRFNLVIGWFFIFGGVVLQIILYSFLLILGMFVSQVLDLSNLKTILSSITMTCLAYIMIEVGLEFTLDKKRLKSYGWDYVVAATAAAFPWIFCAIYFIAFFDIPWKEALLIGRFAAPTSAGVLFAMLAAAGLASTWLFRKAQVLAIFDDLDTVLLMIPLQIFFVGFQPQLFIVLVLISLLLWAAYRWLHLLKWPSSQGWLLLYGIILVAFTKWLEHTAHIHLEVLLPAFVLGCILYNPEHAKPDAHHDHEHAYLEPEEKKLRILDKLIKGSFMFLVGSSLPKISFADIRLAEIAAHVLALTVLSNLGKCFPSFCYRKEASLKERIALSVAMFPRGEVGAGVLLVALNYGLAGIPTTLSVISLALNLILTGFFIAIVKKLLPPTPKAI